MAKEKNGNKIRLKPYHIILLSCLLSTLMIMNSNHVNFQRKEKENEELFNKIIKGRMLQQNENENTKEICSRASDELNDYYKTGDPSKIELDDSAIECEDKDKSYMKTLIDIARNALGDKPAKTETTEDNTNPPSGDRRVLRNLEGDLDTDQLIEYGMRILPMVVFLAFGILSIFGWIVCCFCCCCNCCCCCCCKKEGCKIPCFVFTYVFYVLVVGVSLYGLTQSKKIFVGLANTECSLLKFFEQVLHGEIKQEKPRWGGIDAIQDLLSGLTGALNDLRENTVSDLNKNIDDIDEAKETFRGQMASAGNKFFDGSNYNAKYLRDYSGDTNYPYQDKYVLDVVYKFGRQSESVVTDPEDETKTKTIYSYTDNTYLAGWDHEFSTVSTNADTYLKSAKDGFEDVLGSSFDNVEKALKDGTDTLQDIVTPFTDAEKEIGDLLSKFSGEVDEYGKMGVTIVFSVLMGMNAFLAVLMLLLYCFSTKSFTQCCCCRCMFKFCTHVLWNVLAFCTILAFIIGSILGIVGTVGGDMMSLVSYIMSSENFGNTQDPLLLGELGEAKDYIETCIHGDGDISKKLGLEDSLDSLNDINEAESQIVNAKEQFQSIKLQCITYEEIKKRLTEEKNYEAETVLVPLSEVDETKNIPIKYNYILTKINDNANGNYEWSTTSGQKIICEDGSSVKVTYHPSSCKPNHYKGHENDDFKHYSDILDKIDEMVAYANNNNEGVTDSVISVIETLKTSYETFLDSYTGVLNTFLEKIQTITNLVRQYSDKDNLFSFLNGKFIGINLKIILKYLKYSLGVDLYTMGLCLVIVGFSLILSVSCTIFLLVLINMELQKNIQAEKACPATTVPNIGTIVIPYEDALPGATK